MKSVESVRDKISSYIEADFGSRGVGDRRSDPTTK